MVRTNPQRYAPIPWRRAPLQKRLAALQLVLSLLAPGSASQWRLSLPRARVPLLSGVSPCPKLEPPSGVNPSLKLERESESQASAPSGGSPCPKLDSEWREFESQARA